MINQFAQQMATAGSVYGISNLQFSGLTLDPVKRAGFFFAPRMQITRIKSSLVVFEQIAKEENNEITDADVDAEIEKMATMLQHGS